MPDVDVSRATAIQVIANLGLKLVPIPSGTFVMGCPTRQFRDTGPLTTVRISRPFWLGQTEVTHAQWRTIMGTDIVEQARRMLLDDTLHGGLFIMRGDRAKNSDPRELVYNAADNAPIYHVSWAEAVTFCKRLTEHEGAAGRLPDGYEYRLPTEAQWEYACRAGTATLTYAGDSRSKGEPPLSSILSLVAWYDGNSITHYRRRLYKGRKGSSWDNRTIYTAKQRIVGGKEPNAWGLYDMLGNVWEWCSDCGTDSRNLPGGSVVDPMGAASGPYRIVRGGSWRSSEMDCIAGRREYYDPGVRFDDLGFRVALSSVR